MPTQISVTIGATQLMFLSAMFVLALAATLISRRARTKANEEFRSHRSGVSINEGSLRKIRMAEAHRA